MGLGSEGFVGLDPEGFVGLDPAGFVGLSKRQESLFSTLAINQWNTVLKLHKSDTYFISAVDKGEAN